jgi:hypothetical protein
MLPWSSTYTLDLYSSANPPFVVDANIRRNIAAITSIAVISAIYGQKNIYEATASLKKVTEEMVNA